LWIVDNNTSPPAWEIIFFSALSASLLELDYNVLGCDVGPVLMAA
jgi:hypothetical protein